MGANEQGGHQHAHALNHQYQPQHALCTTIAPSTYPSSASEADQATNSAPESTTSPGLSGADQDTASSATSCTQSIPLDAVGEFVVHSDNEASGPTTEEPKGAWQLPLPPHQQPGGRVPGDQPNAARGLKIRISLGPKLTIKKDVAMPVQSPAVPSIGKTEGGASASETILDRLQPSQADAEDAAMEDGCTGDSSCTDTDDDGELIQRAMKAKEELLKRQQELRISKPKRPSSSRPRPGGVTLKLLIDEGLLLPGAGVLNLEYRGLQETGDLLADGRIKWKDSMFESPSAFSIFVKRLVNPSRKADDGWKTVKYCGKYLDHYKLELARKRFGPAMGQSASMPDNSDIELDNMAKRARTGGGSSILTEPGTSGDVESNTPAASEVYKPLASRLQHDSCVLIQPQNAPDIDSGKDDGLQGSDTLIHTKVFPGEASLIHPSLLGI